MFENLFRRYFFRMHLKKTTGLILFSLRAFERIFLMKYKKLPGSDLNVSCICAGGMAFCDLDNLQRCIQIFDKYVEMGGNVIDTANLYGKWLPAGTNISEIEIGNWMKKRNNRSKLVLGTKGGHPHMDTMDIARLNKSDVGDDLNESLAALQTDYVDIYWMHRDDENKPVEEIIDFLSYYKNQGKIRYFGVSNWKPDVLSRRSGIRKRKG